MTNLQLTLSIESLQTKNLQLKLSLQFSNEKSKFETSNISRNCQLELSNWKSFNWKFQTLTYYIIRLLFLQIQMYIVNGQLFIFIKYYSSEIITILNIILSSKGGGVGAGLIKKSDP